jgi:hypothetical protein
MKDFHVQIATVFPPVQKIGTNKGRTFRATIVSSNRRKLSAFVKLLNIEDIAKEVLCAVLARKLHLPMLQPFYVGVDPFYLDGYPLANSQNVAFGIEEDSLRSWRIRGNIESELVAWPEIERCAVFDLWIGNEDRYPDNLLFAGNKHFWLIDHEECLSASLKPESIIRSRLIEILGNGMKEFALHAMRKRLLHFVEDYKKIDWQEVLDLVLPDQIDGIEKHYLKYISFLKNRTHVMHDVVSECLGIKQRELELSHPSKMEGVIKP